VRVLLSCRVLALVVALAAGAPGQTPLKQVPTGLDDHVGRYELTPTFHLLPDGGP